MKVRVIFAIVAATLLVVARADASTVTVRASRLTFNQALAACPGALGSVSFTLGHARVAGHPGVTEDTDFASPGIATVQLMRDSDRRFAIVTTNGHDQTVNGKHVTLASGNRVACVMPE